MQLRRLLIGAAVGIPLLGAMGVVGTLALLHHEHSTPLTLPEPTGRYPVGRVSYAWLDSARADPYGTVAGARRELVVWIWYPARPTPDDRPAEYVPAPLRRAMATHWRGMMADYFTRDLALVHPHALADAPLAPGRFPVLLLKSGIGALAIDYTTLAEDLASRGYVVVGNDTPYSTGLVVYPDGRVVTPTARANPGDGRGGAHAEAWADTLVGVWSADTRFELDRLARLNASDPSGRFTGRLDLTRVGAVGHSFGGATAAQFCHDDARCRAAIDLDGQPFGSVVREGVRRPLLILLSDHGSAGDSVSRHILARLDSLYERARAGRTWATLRGAHHFSFTDMSLTKSQYVLHALGRLGVMGGLDGRRGLAATAALVGAFFDQRLRGAPAAELTQVPGRFPEVHLER